MQLTESEIHAIKQRVKKRIEEGLKRDQIMGIIRDLSRSQGSYGRLYQFLRSGSDDAESVLQDMEDRCFNDATDLVMYIEEGCRKKGKLVKEDVYHNQELEELWNNIIEHGIATEAELQLVTTINGYSIETLNDILYARTGYRDWSQYSDED